MKNFRRKAAPAFVLLAGASMSLAGVTFAWFNQNIAVNVDNIKVNVVDASGGIAIAKDDVDGIYKKSLNFGTGADEAEDFEGLALEPLSTNKLQSDNKMFDFYKGSLETTDSSKITSGAYSTSPNGATGYYEFDLFFENVSGQTRKVYFDYGKLTDTYNESSDYADLVAQMLPNGDTNHEAQYSLRIGFINLGSSIDKGGTRSATGSYTIVEPDHLRHTEYADGVLGTGLNVRDTTYALVSGFSTAEKIRPGADVTGKMEAQKTYSISECGKQDPFAHPLFVVAPGYTDIKVVIWLEGQDVDNDNSVSGMNFDINLAFTTKTESELVKDAKPIAQDKLDAMKLVSDYVSTDDRDDIVDAAKDAIEDDGCNSIALIETQLNDAETSLADLLRTNTKSDAITELEGYRLGVKKGEVGSEENFDYGSPSAVPQENNYQLALAAAKTAINAATTVSGVKSALATGKANIDTILNNWLAA